MRGPPQDVPLVAEAAVVGVVQRVGLDLLMEPGHEEQNVFEGISAGVPQQVRLLVK